MLTQATNGNRVASKSCAHIVSRGVILAAAAFGICSAPAGAGDRVWSDPLGGLFGDGGNWSPTSVPLAGDRAVFSDGDTYTVNFSFDPTNLELIFDGGTKSFIGTGGPRTYTVAGDFYATSGGLTFDDLGLHVMGFMTVGGSVEMLGGSAYEVDSVLVVGGGGGGTLLLDNGLANHANAVLIGTSTLPGDGLVDVAGPYTTFDIYGSGSAIGTDGYHGELTYRDGASGEFFGDLNLGSDAPSVGSSGTLNVLNGSQLAVRDLNVGAHLVSGTWSVLVDGPGSAIVQDTSSPWGLDIGSTIGGGAGSITVSNEAEFHTSTGTTWIEDFGTITVDSASFHLNGDMQISGGTYERRESVPQTGIQPLIDMAPGSAMTVNGGSIQAYDEPFAIWGGTVDLTGLVSQLTTNGTALYLGDTNVSVGSTCSVNVGNTLSIGSTPADAPGLTGLYLNQATLNVAGLSWIGDTQDGRLLLDNYSAANVSATIIGNTTHEGTLEITGGSSMSSSRFMWIGSANAETTGHLTISGLGSSLQHDLEFNPYKVRVGNAGLGFGEVVVANEATFSVVGPSSTVPQFEVNPNGMVTIDNATLSVAVNFGIDGGFMQRINGGTFDVASGRTVTVSNGGLIDFDGSYVFGGTDPMNPTSYEIIDGGVAEVTYAWRIGDGAGTYGHTWVSGSAAPMTARGGQRSTLHGTGGGGGADIVVGHNGTGTLLVDDGGLVSLGDDFIIGGNATGSGTAYVEGVGASGLRSTVEMNGNGPNSCLHIGGSDGAGTAGADGTLYVRWGGLVDSSGDAFMARLAGSTASITVEYESSGYPATIDFADDIFIGGSASAAGGTADLTINTGGLAIAGDLVHVWDNGTLTLNGGTLRANRLQAEPTAIVNLLAGRVELNQSLSDVVNLGATLAPGSNGVGTLTVPSYNAQPGAALEIEIRGEDDLDPGRQLADLLNVNSQLDLGGALVIQLVDGYVPSVGRQYTVATSGDPVNGWFGSIVNPSHATFDASLVGPDIVLTVTDSCREDSTGDGQVDVTDLLGLLAKWGVCGAPCPEDADEDGSVNITDLLDLLAAWGACP